MLIFAKSASELREMLELLHDELDEVGLEMHSSKSKIMTSFNDLNVDDFVKEFYGKYAPEENLQEKQDYIFKFSMHFFNLH